MPLFHHPAEVCMTYTEHACFALWLSGKLAVAAAASLVHAFLPDIFERTSSSIIVELERVLRKTGCHKDETES